MPFLNESALLSDLRKTKKQTKRKMRDKLIVWDNCFEILLSVFDAINKIESDRKLDKSLIYFRYNEFVKIFVWNWICITSSAYYSAIRDLRYGLESMAQAFYLDDRHPKATMSSKFEIIQEMDEWFREYKVFAKLRINRKKEFYDLYRELSQYIHATHIEVKAAVTGESLGSVWGFDFNKERFLKSLNLTTRTFDAIIYLILICFPKVTLSLSNNKKFLQLLKRAGLILVEEVMIRTKPKNIKKQ